MNPLWIFAAFTIWAGLSAVAATFMHACEVTNGADW